MRAVGQSSDCRFDWLLGGSSTAMPDGNSCLLQSVCGTLPLWKGGLILKRERAHRPKTVSDQPLIPSLIRSKAEKPWSAYIAL